MIIAITVIYLNEQSNSNQQVSTCNNKRIDCEDDYDSRNWEHIYDEVKYQNINVLKDKFQGIPFGIHVWIIMKFLYRKSGLFGTILILFFV